MLAFSERGKPYAGLALVRDALDRVALDRFLVAVLPSYSREVLGAGPDPVALRDAAERARDACAAAISVTP